MWFFRSRALSRNASNSGSAAAALLRLGIEWVLRMPSASCSWVSAMASVDFSTKSLEVGCSMASSLPDRGFVGHPGQDFGDVPYLDGAALALQLAGDVHQAAEIAGEQMPSAAGDDVGGLALD